MKKASLSGQTLGTLTAHSDITHPTGTIIMAGAAIIAGTIIGGTIHGAILGTTMLGIQPTTIIFTQSTVPASLPT